jgi:hypothetical protein
MIHEDCLASCIIKIIVVSAGLLFSGCLDGNKLGGDANGESLESVEERARSTRWVDHHRHGSL